MSAERTLQAPSCKHSNKLILLASLEIHLNEGKHRNIATFAHQGDKSIHCTKASAPIARTLVTLLDKTSILPLVTTIRVNVCRSSCVVPFIIAQF